MASITEPPAGIVRIPAWAVALFITTLLAVIGAGLSISKQIGEASAEIHNSVERIAAIEGRLNALAEIQGRLAVAESKIEADRQRLDRLEQRDDREARDRVASMPRP